MQYSNFVHSFPTSLLRLAKNEHLDIGTQFAFIFSCEKEEGKNGGERHEVYSLFCCCFMNEETKRKRMIKLYSSRKKRCWQIVFWSSLRKED